MRQFTHAGSSFVLGRHDDGSWAIWHFGHHWSSPVRVFAPGEEGWSQATTTLRTWDPPARPLGPEQIQSLMTQSIAVAPVQQYPVAPMPIYAVAPYGAQPSNGIATAGGVVGIVGAILSLIPLLGIFIGIPAGIVAIVLASVGLGRAGPTGVGRGMAITGLVLGILTVVFKLIPGVQLL